jgi:HTH-type transcriptional regulator, competence development regulator
VQAILSIVLVIIQNTQTMDETFGHKIKELREAAMLKLRDVSRSTGLTSGYLSLLENGKQIGLPSEETIRKIAELYGANADELILLADKLPSDEYEAIKSARRNGTLSKEHVFEMLRTATK